MYHGPRTSAFGRAQSSGLKVFYLQQGVPRLTIGDTYAQPAPPLAPRSGEIFSGYKGVINSEKQLEGGPSGHL